MIKNLIYLVILALGFPTGIILSKLCKDEIRNWRKRLIVISIISLIGIGLVNFINFEYKIPVIVTLFFIIITEMTVFWSSYR